MGFDITRAQGILKRTVDKQVHQILYSVDNAKMNPGFIGLKRDNGRKVTTPFGEAFEVPIEFGELGSASADYSVAKTIGDATGVGTAVAYDKFLVTPKNYYVYHRVDGDVLDRCKEEGAYIKAGAKIVKDALRAHMRRLLIHSHGEGDGVIGRIIASGGVGAAPDFIKIDPSQVRNVEKGSRLVAALTKTGALRSATSLVVTGRNSVTGQLDLSASPVALGWANSDYIKFEGDTNAVFPGYFGWIPQTDPTSTLFYNVNRVTDVVRLGGIRFDASGLGPRQALIRAAVAAAGEGAPIDRVRVSIADYGQIIEDGDELKTVELNSENLVIGFKGVSLPMPVGSGVVAVVPDESVPITHAVMEDTTSWRLLTADGAVASVMQHDGLIIRKIESADAYAVWTKSMIAPVCSRPGHNVHILNYNGTS